MTSKRGHQPRRDEHSSAGFPKRYWWLVLVVVPIAGALIQYPLWKSASGESAASSSVSRNQFLGTNFVGNVSLVVNEAEKVALDPALIESLKEAIESSKSRNHDAAIAKIEAVRASGFENAVKATLTQGEIGQGVSVKPTRKSRWLKLRILTNYGDPTLTGLGDISVVGRPNPQ